MAGTSSDAFNKRISIDATVNTKNTVDNLNELIERLTTIKQVVDNMSRQELALNVVIRNQNFNNVMDEFERRFVRVTNRTREFSDTVNKNLKNSVDKSFDGTADEFQNQIDKISKQVDRLGEHISKTLERAVKNFSQGLDGQVSKRLQRAFSANQNKTANELFRENGEIDRQMRDLSEGINTATVNLAKRLKESTDNLMAAVKQIVKASQGIVHDSTAVSKAGARAAAEEQVRRAGLQPGQMTGYEKQLANNATLIAKQSAENSRIANEAQIARKNERSDIILQKEKNNLVYEEAKAKKEILRTEAETTKYLAQAHLQQAKASESEFNLAQRKQEVFMTDKRMQQQMAAIQQANADANKRNTNEMSELEKATLRRQQAEMRVQEQILSTERKRHVAVSAINKAAQERRSATIAEQEAIYKMVAGYDNLKDSGKQLVRNLRGVSSTAQRVSTLFSSLNGLYASFQNISNSIMNTLIRTGSSLFRAATSGLRSVISEATESYKTLQIAEIGFTNFYDANTAKSLISQIKTEAIAAPGLSSSDLADYVRQLAPVSNGDSQMALNAALGMLKTIQYGGAEASEEMEYVIKNVRDVISKGTATTIDLRQFNRAMPIITEVLQSIGASDFIKNGNLKIDKKNAKDILKAFSDINTSANSPVKDVYAQIGNTLSGLQESVKETFVQGVNNKLTELGVYGRVEALLKMLRDDGLIDQFLDGIGSIAEKLVNFLEKQDWNSIGNAFFEAANNVWKSIKNMVRGAQDALGGISIPELIRQVGSLLTSFIDGVKNGLSAFLSILNWLQKNVDVNSLKSLASALGFVASPLGNIIKGILNFTKNAAGVVRSTTGISANLIEGAVGKQLISIEKSAKIFSESGTNITNALRTSGVLGVGNSYYGKVNNKSLMVYNKAQDFVSTYNATTGQFDTHGGVSNLGWWDRMSLIGGGNIAKGVLRSSKDTVKNITSKVRTFASKAIKSFAIYEIGNTLTAVASGIAREATGNDNLASTIDALGGTVSAAIGVGSQFGLLAGAAAGLVNTFIDLYKETKNLKDAQSALAEQTEKNATDKVVTEAEVAILQQLQERGLYTAFDDIDETAKSDLLDQLQEDIKAGRSWNYIMQNGLDTYLKTRATLNSQTDLSNWAQSIDLGTSSTTALNKDNANQYADTIRTVYENLKKLGVMPALDDETILSDAASIRAYMGKNNIDFTSVEALNAFYKKTNELVKELDANISDSKFELKVAFTDAEGSTKSANSWDEYMSKQGFIWTSAGWMQTATLELLIKTKNDANMSDWDRVIDSIFNGGVGTTKPKLNSDTLNSLIRPIYRASGGGITARGVDTVPAMLQPGEFVVSKPHADKVGHAVLNAINTGDLSKAAHLLGAKVNQHWNNARSYSRSIVNSTKNVHNDVRIFPRTRSGTLNSYSSLANRLAAGF